MNTKWKDPKDLVVYYGWDQPVTCPMCGRRTEYIELNDVLEQHRCDPCDYNFIADLFDDEQDEEE